ncbi:MAG TPA: DUF4915 domain-containing protein [Rhodopila sp.]
MIVPNGITLLGTVCNAISNAVPYALWLARGTDQYLVDLSDSLGQAGDSGLTGLACHGERIYAAVQSGPAARILILDRSLAPVGTIASPEFADIHSIHVAGDSLIVCSTGARSVVRVNLTDHSVTKLWACDANIHLNAACFDAEDLLICCHYASHVVPKAVDGGVINASRRQVALVGLLQPHSLLRYKNTFFVLDSDGHRVIQFDHSGVRRQQFLPGFLRGLTVCDGSLFVASSAGRIISRKNPVVPSSREFWDMEAEPVRIYELDEATFQLRAKHTPLVAGFEIYELLALAGPDAVSPPPERLVVPDIYAIARAYYEAAKRALVR